jgi:hypothetical protein
MLDEADADDEPQRKRDPVEWRLDANGSEQTD